MDAWVLGPFEARSGVLFWEKLSDATATRPASGCATARTTRATLNDVIKYSRTLDARNDDEWSCWRRCRALFETWTEPTL